MAKHIGEVGRCGGQGCVFVYVVAEGGGDGGAAARAAGGRPVCLGGRPPAAMRPALDARGSVRSWGPLLCQPHRAGGGAGSPLLPFLGTFWLAGLLPSWQLPEGPGRQPPHRAVRAPATC